MQRKTIKVSMQRPFVIPKEFYDVLGNRYKVPIELHEGKLIIKTVMKMVEDFAENLLAELIATGFSGEELVARFKEVKQQVLNEEQPSFVDNFQ